MRIAVVGPGGIGGYFGGRLAVAGHDVHFVARGAQLRALREYGLKVQSPDGDFAIGQPSATDDAAAIGEVDLVIIAVKTWQLPAALSSVKALVGTETAVLTTQNGVEAPRQVADVVGVDSVLPGVAKIICSLDAPGRVRHLGGAGSLTFAEWDNRDSARMRLLRGAFRDSGVKVPDATEIWRELWSKFLFIVPFGALGSVTDAPAGELRTRPGTRTLLARGMAEIHDVARANGVELPADIVASTLAFLDAQPAAATSSLHRDIAAGRPSELDALTGAVVRLAGDTPIPVLGLLHEVLSLRTARREQR